MQKVSIFAFADEASAAFDGQIAAMRRNGLDGLEIRNVSGKNVSDFTADEARELKKQMDDAGLITWSIGSPIGKIDIEKGNFKAHLEKFKSTLETAHLLGAGNIRLFSFYIPKEKPAGDYKNEVIDRLGEFVRLADGSGVTLCHENEKGIYGDTAERCLDILKALPGIKGIFDPANFVQCKQDTAAAWEMLNAYVLYLHIKDALADGKVVPAGKGIGHLPEIVTKYLAAGGTAMTLEPHLAVFDGLNALEREGEVSKVGAVYHSKDAAFDAACDALKTILKRHASVNLCEGRT